MDITPLVSHTTKYCLRSHLCCSSRSTKHFSIESTLCTFLFFGDFLPHIKVSHERYKDCYEKDVDIVELRLPDGRSPSRLVMR